PGRRRLPARGRECGGKVAEVKPLDQTEGGFGVAPHTPVWLRGVGEKNAAHFLFENRCGKPERRALQIGGDELAFHVFEPLHRVAEGVFRRSFIEHAPARRNTFEYASAP